MNNKNFTLIELIVVIAILGILASLIVPNISNFKEDATVTAIANNVRNFQTSVDMYSLKNNGEYPTTIQPTELIPQPIDFSKLDKKYLRTLPKTEGVKYWVDFQGRVWASTIDAPKNVTNTNGNITWSPVTGAVKYQVFEVQGYRGVIGSLAPSKANLVLKGETTTTSYTGEAGKYYTVNAIDKQNFQTAPSGKDYAGYAENNGVTPPTPVVTKKVGDTLSQPETGWKRIDDTDSKILYIGDTKAWSSSSNVSEHINSTMHWKNFYIDGRGTIKFTFYGTKLRLITSLNNSGPQNAKITIDGSSETFSEYDTINYMTGSKHNILVYEKTGLSLGEHTVSITIDPSIPISGNNSLSLDAIDIDDTGYLISSTGIQLNNPETGWKRIDGSDTKISSNTTEITDASAIGSKYYTLGNKNDYVSFKFTGTKLRVITVVSQGTYPGGNVNINIDGQNHSFSTLGPTQYKTLTFQKENLENKVHTVKISNPNGGTFIWFDAIDIDETGSLVAQVGSQLLSPESTWKRIDDSDSKIVYGGSAWTVGSGAMHYNGGQHQSNTSDISISFKFYGTKMRLITGNQNNLSSGVKISIDGSPVETFSIYNANTTIYQSLTYEKTGLSLGEHTVTITKPDTNWIMFDAIDIDDTGYLIRPMVPNMQGIAIPEDTTYLTNANYATTIGAMTFDGNINSAWGSSSVAGWIQYNFTVPQQISKIQVAATGTPENSQTYTIYGYKNGVWGQIGSGSRIVCDPSRISSNPSLALLEPINVTPNIYEKIKIDINGGNAWVGVREVTLIP